MASSLPQDEATNTFSSTPPVVITAGSYTCRAGFSSESCPCSVIPSVVGTDGADNIMHCGKEAISMRSSIKLRYPIYHGIVTNYTMVEKLFGHVFYNELKVEPGNHAVMLSEVPIGPKVNRERMTQLMFEGLNVGALSIKQQMMLSLIASGRTTGLVVHSGSDVSRIVPLYQGYSLPHAILRLDKGGNGVTHSLIDMLAERGYSFTTPQEEEAVQRMKEKLAFVPEMSEPSCTQEEYRLPDGTAIELGRERFRCTEFLFAPSQTGIGDCAFSSAMKCDVDIRGVLMNNVVLSGGNSMLRGFGRRLERELRESASVYAPVRVLSPPARDFSGWYGGAVLASHSSMSSQWITRAEYDDHGPSIANRKSF